MIFFFIIIACFSRHPGVRHDGLPNFVPEKTIRHRIGVAGVWVLGRGWAGPGRLVASRRMDARRGPTVVIGDDPSGKVGPEHRLSVRSVRLPALAQSLRVIATVAVVLRFFVLARDPNCFHRPRYSAPLKCRFSNCTLSPRPRGASFSPV